MDTEPQPLLIATFNQGKIQELDSLLEGLNFRVMGFSDLTEIPEMVEETGATYAENALLKAERYHQFSGLMTLSDDSGLEVDALGGRPGIYSARYGGEGLSSDEQISLLLSEMADVPDDLRTARFVCSIALVGNNLKQIFEASCNGLISRQRAGNGGFGYDPIFFHPATGRTFAELTREEKAILSHRGQALRMARNFLSGR